MIASLHGREDRALTAVAIIALVAASLPALLAGKWIGWLHMLPLIILLAAQTFLLARVARLRGGSPALGQLLTAAAWAQVNTYAWSTLRPQGAAAILMGACLLLAIVMHHRAVRLASQERSAVASMVLAMLASSLALISRAEAVLLPLIVAWLEVVRWRRLGPSAPRAARASWIAIALPVVAWIALRVLVPAFPIPSVGHDAPQIRPPWAINLALAVVHLGALPIVVALLTRVLYPAAWLPAARGSVGAGPRGRSGGGGLGGVRGAADAGERPACPCRAPGTGARGGVRGGAHRGMGGRRAGASVRACRARGAGDRRALGDRAARDRGVGARRGLVALVRCGRGAHDPLRSSR